MDRKDVITQLRQAKSAHIKWRSYAQALVAGIPVDKDQVPVVHTNCAFGKWYYGKGQALSSLTAYSAIETPHEMLHQIYMKMFTLMFGDLNQSLLGKIFGSSAKTKQKNREQAAVLLKDLLSVSETLMDAIALLETEVKEMSDDELAELF